MRSYVFKIEKLGFAPREIWKDRARVGYFQETEQKFVASVMTDENLFSVRSRGNTIGQAVAGLRIPAAPLRPATLACLCCPSFYNKV